MKLKSMLFMSIAATFALAACSKEEKAADAGKGGAGEGYPLTVCVVSGEKLGEMGKPVEYDYKGTLVKFCCKECIGKFENEPEKYLAKLKEVSE